MGICIVKIQAKFLQTKNFLLTNRIIRNQQFFMKTLVFAILLIYATLNSCTNNQPNPNPSPTLSTPQTKLMDNFQYTLKSAHPNAQALMTENFYFSPIEETGPFGSDDGSDAAYGFREWRLLNKTTSPVVYLEELITAWQYPYFDYNEMDTATIKAYINQEKKLSEVEILQHINLLKEMTEKSPDHSGKQLNDQELREIVISSTKTMNDRYLLGLDNAIIGIGFAQFVLEGRVDSDIKTLTITSINRQLLPLLINRYSEVYQKTRKDQLMKMLRVMRKANS